MRKRERRSNELRGFVGGIIGILLIWAGTAMLYRAVSIMEYTALWDHQPRALMAYTRIADSRYRTAFDDARMSAARRGWIIPDFRLRQTTQMFDLWYKRWTSTHGMSIAVRDRELIIDDRHMALMSDTELTCAMSHEVAHAVDVTYGRERDMKLHPFRCEENERFADIVGAMLCGHKQYASFFRRHIEYRYPSASPCRP